MIKRKKLQKRDIIAIVALGAFLTMFLCRNDDHEEKVDPRLTVQLEDAIGRGFEAFASKDSYNAEIIFSSFFDKKGNELNAFRKINFSQQLLTRSLYGDILFHKKNFQKAEIIWRPIFKNAPTMNHFISSGTPHKDILFSYVTILKNHKNLQEISRIFDLCYRENGDATEILKKFGDHPTLRTTLGEIFFQKREYRKVIRALKPLFENQKLLSELTYEQEAVARWYYGYSLICEDKNGEAEIVLSAFFDEDLKAKKSFEKLNHEDQIFCRIQYAQLLLNAEKKENNSEKIGKLLEVFFDKNDELIPLAKNSPFQDVIAGIYGNTLCEQGNFPKAKRILKRFFEPGNNQLVKNFSADEISLIVSLCANINRMYVKQW